MENIHDIFSYIRENKTISIRCKKCDSIVLKEPKKITYPYWCPNCDKYLYEIDTLESYREMSSDELLTIVEKYLNKKERSNEY